MSIKSISSALSICVCAGLLSSNAYAAIIIDQTSGLASPDIIINFGVDSYPVGTIIDDEFVGSGVTFGPTFEYGIESNTYLALAQGHLQNINAIDQPGSILFSLDVTAADFSWRTSNGETTFSAYHDDLLVEQFTAFTNTSLSGGRYFGFKNILFDEIRLSIAARDTLFTLDNLEYVSAIPVPAAVWLFGSGLLGLIGVARRNS